MRHISVLIFPIVREIRCARAGTLALPMAEKRRGSPPRRISINRCGGRVIAIPCPQEQVNYTRPLCPQVSETYGATDLEIS